MLFDEQAQEDFLEYLNSVERGIQTIKNPKEIINKLSEVVKDIPVEMQSFILFCGAIASSKAMDRPQTLLEQYLLMLHEELEVLDRKQDEQC